MREKKKHETFDFHKQRKEGRKQFFFPCEKKANKLEWEKNLKRMIQIYAEIRENWSVGSYNERVE